MSFVTSKRFHLFTLELDAINWGIRTNDKILPAIVSGKSIDLIWIGLILGVCGIELIALLTLTSQLKPLIYP